MGAVRLRRPRDPSWFHCNRTGLRAPLGPACRRVAAPLPIDEVLGEVLARLKKSPNLVLRAPPGAGKTTRVAPAMLDAGLVPKGERIIMLQPRRVAARASARRIASERNVRLGDEVGYHVRHDDRTSARTRIAILTEGLLTRKLQADPTLEGVGAVILDEFHERSIHADLAIAFLREIQETVRPDLKIVVMSATLETGRVARYLGDAPIVESPGRTFPVRVDYLEKSDDRWADEQVVGAIKRILRDESDDGGDILCFLPGAGEIRRAESTLRPIVGDRMDVRPLYGELDADAQDRALSRGGRRKIVLATNIAETSLTIEGVTWVVDSGLAKVLRHDPARGGDRLETSRISRASADQRAGRAGRTAPGRAIRLWTEAEQSRLSESDAAEISRIDLAPVVMEVLAWSTTDPREFRWFEPPPPASVERALDTLRALGVVERNRYAMTPLGERVRQFPLHPRLGAMMVEAHRLGVVPEGALAAAVASERDPMRRGAETDHVESSDLLVRGSRVAELEESRWSLSLATRIGNDVERARGIARVRDQLEDVAGRVLGKAPPRPADTESATLRAVLAGYGDRVAKRRAEGGERVVMVGGRGAKLAKESVVKAAPLLVVVELDDTRREAESLVRMASAIEEEWLASRVEKRAVYRFNAERQAVEMVVVRQYFDLVLSERYERGGPAVDSTAVERVLMEAARADPTRAFAVDAEADALLQRLAFLATVMPELELPVIDRAGLVGLLPDIVGGKKSFGELRQVDLSQAIRNQLGYKRAADVDKHAPMKLPVPSGSQILLRYEPGGPPTLAVRLQEVFGLETTPRIAAGRVPVRLELLGPNYRPVQVTQDLKSFWDGTYQEVRKELRARYPKHSWPDDPRQAEAVRGPRRRGS
jgi:ATP-dependent helicase HrpB